MRWKDIWMAYVALSIAGLGAGCSSNKTYRTSGTMASLASDSTDGESSTPSMSAGATRSGATSESGSRGAESISSQDNQITNPTALTSVTDPSTMAGKQVKFSNVKVQQIIDDHLVAIGSAGQPPIYIRLHDRVQNLKEGDSVNLTGMVQQMSSNPSELGFSGPAAEALQSAKIYVDAQKLEPANP